MVDASASLNLDDSLVRAFLPGSSSLDCSLPMLGDLSLSAFDRVDRGEGRGEQETSFERFNAQLSDGREAGCIGERKDGLGSQVTFEKEDCNALFGADLDFEGGGGAKSLLSFHGTDDSAASALRVESEKRENCVNPTVDVKFISTSQTKKRPRGESSTSFSSSSEPLDSLKKKLWSEGELNRFYEAVAVHEADFQAVARQVGTKKVDQVCHFLNTASIARSTKEFHTSPLSVRYVPCFVKHTGALGSTFEAKE